LAEMLKEGITARHPRGLQKDLEQIAKATKNNEVREIFLATIRSLE